MAKWSEFGFASEQDLLDRCKTEKNGSMWLNWGKQDDNQKYWYDTFLFSVQYIDGPEKLDSYDLDIYAHPNFLVIATISHYLQTNRT